MRRKVETNSWRSAAARRVVALAGGSASVEEAIKLLAQSAAASVHYPPVDLCAVAQHVGVESIRTEELPIAGELRKTQGGYEVVIDRGASQGAKRFTLAHEIGHAFFSSLDNRFPKRGVEVERICDLFAVELLFPESLFRIEYGGRPASVDSLFELADHFGASIMATAKRVSELYGAFVFQLDAGEVKWRSGKIRLPRETEPLIERLRMNGRARGEFVAKVGRWPSQWAFDGVQKGTSLFVLISPSANSSTTLVRTPALNRKQAGDTLSRFGK